MLLLALLSQYTMKYLVN